MEVDFFFLGLDCIESRLLFDSDESYFFPNKGEFIIIS